MSDDRTVAVTPLACAVVLTAQMATTIYLPSLPKIATDLGIEDSVVKWSVTLFVISAALPVVVWGRLADRLGRRTALLSSLVLFVIACVALALVQSAAVLLIGRIVQGIGAGGAAIIVRMMVKDKFTGSELASRLSLLSMAFVVALGGGQLIGGALASFTSWRTGFGVFGVLGDSTRCGGTEDREHHSPRQQRTRCSVECHSPDTPVLQTSHCGGPGFRRDSPGAAIEYLFLFSDRFDLQPWAFGAFGILYGTAYFSGAFYVNRRATNRRFKEEVDASRCAVHAACRPRPHALLVSPTRFHAVARGFPARIHRTDIWAITSLPELGSISSDAFC